MKARILFFTFFIFLAAQKLIAQQPVSDTSKLVEILSGKSLRLQKLDDNTQLQILVGNARVKQGSTLFYCDSCVINNQAHIVEAFGHVRINSDTTNVYSNYLRYHSDTKMAYLNGNVKLTDGHGVLTTNELEYDVAQQIGTYKNGGKVVNKKSVLTSKEGTYYADLKDVYFRNNVELKDPGYYLKSDSLLYNTQTQVARFIAPTFLRDSSKRTIETSEGYYDMRTGRAEFTQRTTIVDKSMRIVGNQIASDDSTGIVQILGNGVLIDTAQGISILANEIFADKKKAAYLATRKPLMIIRQDKDSIYVTADTLFSARLTDRFPVNDTVKKAAIVNGKKGQKQVKEDSTNRYFEAFKNVRIFTDSVQAVSDSLFYSFKDSTFQLFQNPFVWSNGNQLHGDTIYLYTKNKKADRVRIFENSFVINQLAPGVFNQVKATRMDGYFKKGVIDSIRAKGFAESVYYLRDDKDSSYSGINQTSSDVMDVFFREGNLKKVVFRSNVKGTLWPIGQKTKEEMHLPNFNWQEARRPKTKYELFE
jgi:lipopolysaccharide export system protein LptA